MELKEVLAAMRTAWWLPAVGLIAGAVAALLLALSQTPLYTSHARLYVTATATSSLADAFQGSQLSQARMMSYAELVTSHTMTSRVIDELDLAMTPDELAGEITATALPDTVLLDITVTDPSPQRAFDIAETVGEEFNVVVGQLETASDAPQDTTVTPVRVTVVTAPEVPTTASSPRTQRNVALGALVGLLGGVAAAVTRSRMDSTVRDPEDAASLTGTPVLGTVRHDKGFDEHALYVQATATGIAEDYRQLRTNLAHLGGGSPPKTVMICSAGPAEGKTALVVNLALALTEAGRRVTVVEADLRRPRVTRYLGLPGGDGLTNLLAGTAEIGDVTEQYRDEDLYVVPAGPLPADAGGLLASARMTPLIKALKEENDVVLIDTPPLLAVADASGLVAIVDGVLLVARYGHTRQKDLQQARRTLDGVGARILGLVLTVVPPRSGATAVDAARYRYEPDSVRSTPYAHHPAGETPAGRGPSPARPAPPRGASTGAPREAPTAPDVPEAPTPPDGDDVRGERRPA